VYIYRRPLPIGVNEVVFPCADGWTVWIADRLDRKQAQEAYKHAVAHIQRGDFNKSDVGMIEIGVRLDDHANIHI
jgi:hypothetical protein